MDTIKERCSEVMAEIMEVDVASINVNTNPDTLEQWDSLTHVQLVIGLEKEFGVKISPEEGIEFFTGFNEIVRFLNDKVKQSRV